ncbi:MAG: type II secretion system protein GspG [Deltaproteobacteria bacterium]|nr:type II secretion system protein GspG [Deltaproteobacteria bacterium]
MVAAAVSVSVLGRWRDARCSTAKIDLLTIDTVLELHTARYGEVPTTDQGLALLLERGFVKTALIDPWRKPYLYRQPGTHNPRGPDVGTLGGDGRSGGRGEDTDLYLGESDLRSPGCEP